MSDYEYQDQNDPVEINDEQYHAKTRNDTNKNIKLLKEILVAQKSPSQKNDYIDEPPKRKRKIKKNDEIFSYSVNLLKEPLIMIVLYVILHTSQVNNLLIRYLPKIVTNPDNIFFYFGSRGLLFTIVYYLIRYQLQ